MYNKAPDYARNYLDLIESDNLLMELEKSHDRTMQIFNAIPVDLEDYFYSPGKWTIKEVLRHIIDCERIFAYRALRFSRFDHTELPGFDEGQFMESLKGTKLSLADLIQEYTYIRKSTIILYKNMTDKMLGFKGTANNKSVSTEVVGFMIVGHNFHHLNVVESRYLAKN